MPFGFVLANPGRRTRRRKATRRFGRARVSRKVNGRKHKKWGGHKAHRRKVNRGHRRARRYSRPRSANPSRRRTRKGKRSHARRRKNFSSAIPLMFPNPGRRHRRKRNGRRVSRGLRRHRNPGGGSLGSMTLALPQIVPLTVPLPGILGTIANNVIQASGYGATFLTGYMASDYVVSMFLPAQGMANAPDPTTFAGKYGRILAFGAMSGITGYGVAKIAVALKLKHPGLIAAIAAAGPAVRAFGGILKLAFADSTTGSFGAFLRDKGGALADFLQLSDFIQDGSGMSGISDESFGLGGGSPQDEYFNLGHDGGEGTPAFDDNCSEMVEAGIDDGSNDVEAVY